MSYWEEVRAEGRAPIRRARISRGWVVLAGYSDDDPGVLRFIEDPQHAWQGEPEFLQAR